MKRSNKVKRTKHIMLVEDDPSFLKIMCLMIQDWGCRVTTCRDGLEALNALRYVEPDLIISDLELPFINGIKLFRKCREMTGEPGIPFVIISGIPDAEERLEEIRDRLVGFYAKPLHVRVLKRIIFEREEERAH